jgi:outer membrane immunogenic protein
MRRVHGVVCDRFRAGRGFDAGARLQQGSCLQGAAAGLLVDGFLPRRSGRLRLGGSQQYDSFGNASTPYDIKGGFGGGTVGYNWQISNWVLGVEGDISKSDIKGAGDSAPGYSCSFPGGCVSDIKWFGTVRGRAGYAAGAWLLYGTGGAAFGRVHTGFSPTTTFDGTNNRTGWTAGAGIEYGFAQHWSAKLEYLHVDLGKDFQWTTFLNGTDPGLTRASFDLVRGGVNYRF